MQRSIPTPTAPDSPSSSVSIFSRLSQYAPSVDKNNLEIIWGRWSLSPMHLVKDVRAMSGMMSAALIFLAGLPKVGAELITFTEKYLHMMDPDGESRHFRARTFLSGESSELADIPAYSMAKLIEGLSERFNMSVTENQWGEFKAMGDFSPFFELAKKVSESAPTLQKEILVYLQDLYSAADQDLKNTLILFTAAITAMIVGVGIGALLCYVKQRSGNEMEDLEAPALNSSLQVDYGSAAFEPDRENVEQDPVTQGYYRPSVR